MIDPAIDRILRAGDGWQTDVAQALARVVRPIPADPRFTPRLRPDGSGASGLPRLPDRSTLPPARAAATLLLLYPGADGDLVLPLTVRHRDLPDHPGEISLPGGAVDPDDASPEVTALREAQEEVGLDPTSVQLAGRLDPIWIPVSNFELVPVVATATRAPVLVQRVEEVEAIVELPLRLLFSADGVGIEQIEVRDAVLEAAVVRHQGHRVWGATARALSMLAQALTPS